MASTIPGYEYDIFISYRQKDNKYDGWVTEFVDNLKKELEATFKEEISVYFDINPHDGLLETHDVDASLKEKLKCLIFVPVLSRTYCDPKSFAWEHEFSPFVKQASTDRFGLKVKLPNGNVASRVLPVFIHELDPDDIKLCESTLKSHLRGIEFIYKEPGVNKPLTDDDDQDKNLNNTKYRIQINKTANSIKEIISGLLIITNDQGTEKEVLDYTSAGQDQEDDKKVFADKTTGDKKRKNKNIIWTASILGNVLFILILLIALKPGPISENDWIIIADFENHTGDDVFDQSLNTALEVSIQQSVYVNVYPRSKINEALRRMGKNKTDAINEDIAVEIALREGITVILSCNISQVGNIYSLTSKIVEVNTGKIIKTGTFQANGKDEVLIALNSLARRIRRDLGESLRDIDRRIVPLPQATTSSIDALKYFVRAMQAWGWDGQTREAIKLLVNALELDPDFALAHAYLGSIYYWLNNRIKGEEHFTKALGLLDRLTEKERLWIEARVEGFRGNYDEAIIRYNMFLRNYPSSPEGWFQLGYSHMRLQRYEEAIPAFERSLEFYKDNDPNIFINLASCLSALEKYPQAVEYYLKAFDVNPNLMVVPNLNHEFGFTYIHMGEYDKAAEVFDRMISGSSDENKARGYRSRALLMMYRGKYQEAIGILQQSVIIQKNLGYFTSELRDRLFLASAYKAKGMISEYNSEMTRASKLLSTSAMEPWWLFLYGKMAVRDGNIQQAEKILNTISERIISGNRSDQAAHNILKGEIELIKGNTAEALDLIEASVNLRYDNYILESLAHYYHVTGESESAASRYKEIIGNKNQLGWEAQEYWILAHYNLGRIYEETGDIGQAIQFYQEFLNIWGDADADLPLITDAKSRMTNLQKQKL